MTSPAAVRFLADRVLTASPAQRVVMLYDRALLDLVRADAAGAQGRTHDASDAVMHALAVVAELQSSLDVSRWDGGPRLLDLYDWTIRELLASRAGADLTRLPAVRTVLTELREAWSAVVSTDVGAVALGGRAS